MSCRTKMNVYNQNPLLEWYPLFSLLSGNNSGCCCQSESSCRCRNRYDNCGCEYENSCGCECGCN